MKILHVSKKYPHALGGDAVVVYNLRRQQQAAGHDVIIVTSNCDEIANSSFVYKFGLKDTPANLDSITVRRMVSLVALFFRMFTILRRERPNVIHTHSVDMAFFVSFAARFYGIPIVHTFHIVTFYDLTQPLVRRKSELWLAKRAKLYLATAANKFDVKKLQAAGLRQAVLLPNGVDVGFWEGGTHQKNSDVFEFLSVGRLEHQKGYEYLIRAVALLADMLPGTFRVIIIGEGSEAETLRKLMHSLHVERLITLAGKKKPEEVRTLLCSADAAVFPSLYETTPITMLEAWAAAVPTIVTAVGIMRDVTPDFDATYIVPSKDERALMRAMSRCITDAPARATVAAKGHKEVKQYAWPVIARTAEAMYRSVA